MDNEKERVSASRQEREMPIYGKIWEEFHGLAERGILLEVEHVETHRTKKGKNTCRILRIVSPKATRRLMNWQKQEQCWTKDLSVARAETMQQEREEVYAALQYVASFHCLVEQWKDCEELTPKPKKSGFSWIRRARIRSIEQSGVRKQTGIDE